VQCWKADLRRDPPQDQVIGRLPGETSCLGLVWAVLDRASRGWRGLTMSPTWHARLCAEARLTLAEAQLALATLRF
jgi:hypothetical protein